MHFNFWYVVFVAIALLAVYAGFNIKSVRKHVMHENGLWRGWLTINDPDYMHRGVDYHLEVAYGRRAARSLGWGFRIHFGDKGSETPFHFDVYLYWVAFFFSMNTPHMGQIFSKICGGHKRNISLRTHSGNLWWELWFDDDMGYDRHHECDKWRSAWWWPFKNKKYRSWMCLRQGSLDLNPLNAWWGPKLYHYNELDKREDTFGVYQFEDDYYEVLFRLMSVLQFREKGPMWARKKVDRGYTVEWQVIGESEKIGIPIRNHAWKGDGVYGSSVNVDSPDNWLGKAHNALQNWVIDQREKYDYRPPVGKIIQVRETDDGIIIEGNIDSISGSQTIKAIKAGEIDGMSIGFDSSGLSESEFIDKHENDLTRVTEWEKQLNKEN